MKCAYVKFISLTNQEHHYKVMDVDANIKLGSIRKDDSGFIGFFPTERSIIYPVELHEICEFLMEIVNEST